MNKFDNVI